MVKKLFFSLLLTVWAVAAQAQLGFLKRAPINLVMDLGISGLRDAPMPMELTPIHSRTVNIYYMKSIRMSNHFSFNLGAGAGMEKYAFSKKVLLESGSQSAIMSNISAFNVRKTLVAVNYADIPLEFRFVSKSGRKAFRLAAGGKIGVRVSSHNKVKFEDGDKSKYKDDFYLNPIRYGVYGRIGYSSFNVFTYYGLSELFRAGKAPEGMPIVPFTFGISLTTF
jgi:hypothetical protein